MAVQPATRLTLWRSVGAANRDDPPRTGRHVCRARKRPIDSRTSRDPDGRSNCYRQRPSHSFGADRRRRAATPLTFHAFNYENTPSWYTPSWSLCANRPVCPPSVEESTIPRCSIWLRWRREYCKASSLEENGRHPDKTSPMETWL